MSDAGIRQRPSFHALPAQGKHLAILCLLVLVALCYAEPAFANANTDWRNYSLEPPAGATSTQGLTDLEVTADFSCTDNGNSVGTLFMNPSCEAGGLFGVFANVVCRVENLFGTVLGSIYCAVQYKIIPPFIALLTLYVIIYGAMVMLGMINQTFSEALKRVFKIALVCAVVMNAHIAIGIGYKFYITAVQESVGVVFSLFDPAGASSTELGSSMQEMIDAGYMADPSNTASGEARGGSHWLESIDNTVHRIIGFFVQGGVGFVMVMLGLFVFMPALFFVVLYLIVSLLKSLAQAVVGYLLALLGITFLFTLAPIFVCFALFQITSGWFQVWLRYLASFTLQMMLVFTFLMFLVMVDLVSFFQNVGMLVRSYQYHFSFGPIHMMLNIPSVCRVRRGGVDGQGDILYYKADMQSLAESRYAGFPQCVEEYTLERLENGDFPPGLNEESQAALRQAVDWVKNNPDETIHSANLPDHDIVIEILAAINHDQIMTWMEAMQDGELISFLLSRFIAVIILTYLLGKFLSQIPEFATRLAGTDIAGRLGGGVSANPNSQKPGLQDEEPSAIEYGLQRFKEHSMADGMYPKGFIRSAPGRLIGGLGAGISGGATYALQKRFRDGARLGLNNAYRSELGSPPEMLEMYREGMITRSMVDRSPRSSYRGPTQSGITNRIYGQRRQRRGI